MAYTKDPNGNETYGKDAVSKAEKVEHGRYAKNREGEFYYPKKENQDEFIDSQLGYITKEGRPVLPLSLKGTPIYPHHLTNIQDEIYPTDAAGREQFGVGSDGSEYYAQKGNNDEFYPSDHRAAKKADGTPYYAVTSQNRTIFPKENAKELYVTEVDPLNPLTIPTRYAQDVTTEYYPKTVTADGYLSDYILKDTYAKTSANATIYPKDAFNNEFYLPDKDSTGTVRPPANIVVTRYAATNDKKIILPTIDHQPTNVVGVLPAVTLANVIGKLIRERGKRSDALTSIEDPGAPPADPKEYSYVDGFGVVHRVKPVGSTPPAKPSKTSKAVTTAFCTSSKQPIFRKWYFWVIVVMLVMAKSFLLWWFFIKRQVFSSLIK